MKRWSWLWDILSNAWFITLVIMLIAIPLLGSLQRETERLREESHNYSGQVILVDNLSPSWTKVWLEGYSGPIRIVGNYRFQIGSYYNITLDGQGALKEVSTR